jgi:hypothetical protein
MCSRFSIGFGFGHHWNGSFVLALFNGVAQTVQPDLAPPPGQDGGNQSRGATAPKSRGPGTITGQAKTIANEKPDDGPENHKRLHSFNDLAK